MDNNIWMFNLTDSSLWDGEIFNSKEEAISVGMKAAIEHNKKSQDKIGYFQIGIRTDIPIPNIDVDGLLENIDENYHEELSGEWDGGEYIFEKVTHEQSKELDDKLNEVFYEWLNKHKIDGGYFNVTDIEQVFVAS